MKTAAIIQARMTSNRLPGKILKKVMEKPLLAYLLERLRSSRRLDEIIIATTDNGTERPIIELCQTLNITVFRGSEDDVLARYYHAAQAFQVGLVVRITSDCPLMDPRVVDEVVDFYLANQQKFDYVTNRESYPTGMDVEVFPAVCLKEAFEKASLAYEREHVTPYFYTHPEKYRIGYYHFKYNARHYRWTVDTPEDFDLISRLLMYCYPRKAVFSMEDIFNALAANPGWNEMNAHVQAKKLGE